MLSMRLSLYLLHWWHLSHTHIKKRHIHTEKLTTRWNGGKQDRRLPLMREFLYAMCISTNSTLVSRGSSQLVKSYGWQFSHFHKHANAIVNQMPTTPFVIVVLTCGTWAWEQTNTHSHTHSNPNIEIFTVNRTYVFTWLRFEFIRCSNYSV